MVTHDSDRPRGDASGVGQQPNQDPQESAETISAVVPGRLAVQPSSDDLQKILGQKWREQPQEVASRWQLTSVWANFWEMSLVPRVQYGRPHELAGLIASGGEQLALALAAIVEAHLWNSHRETNCPDINTVNGRVIAASQEMCQRSMADLASYYLLSTGHVVANVTGRVLAFDSQLHPALLDTIGSWFPPESHEPNDWLALNVDTIRKLRRVARKSKIEPLQHIADSATTLLTSIHWRKLDQLRGAHYHRWRPQSAGLSGVSSVNPWIFGDGVATMTDVDAYNDGDGLAGTETHIATSAISDLTIAMKSLLNEIELVISRLNPPSRAGEKVID